MKKIVTIGLILMTVLGCGVINGNSPMTAFIVKNTSSEPISFSADVLKHSQTMGPQIITNSFTVKPNDSIIARQTYFKRDGENPQNWFTKFEIYPGSTIEMNDPTKAENWKKSMKDNIPIYTFTLNK